MKLAHGRLAAAKEHTVPDVVLLQAVAVAVADRLFSHHAAARRTLPQALGVKAVVHGPGIARPQVSS